MAPLIRPWPGRYSVATTLYTWPSCLMTTPTRSCDATTIVASCAGIRAVARQPRVTRRLCGQRRLKRCFGASDGPRADDLRMTRFVHAVLHVDSTPNRTGEAGTGQRRGRRQSCPQPGDFRVPGVAFSTLSYSSRSATIGSTREALRAGPSDAAAATPTNTNAATPNVAPSIAVRPYNIDAR
jgi:hypothetical protein